jgi:hypothetical protein
MEGMALIILYVGAAIVIPGWIIVQFVHAISRAWHAGRLEAEQEAEKRRKA